MICRARLLCALQAVAGLGPRRPRRAYELLMLALMLTWPLVAAGPQAAAQPRTVDGAAIDPDAELVVALADDTTNMDPRIGMGSIRSNYIRQVFESLVDVDAQGRPAPDLALAWKPVGELTWEFALRRGVTFHDGEPFNADTVLFNLDRFFRRNLDKWGLKDVLAATQFEKTYPFVSRWEKVDDYTVRIHTSEPAPTLWDFIGREPMVPKAYTVKNGVEGLNDRPVGTGPWKMVEWKRKTSMLFEKNDAYWGTQPLFRTMRFQTIPEGAARIAALRAGQVGLIEGVPPFDAPTLAQDARLKVVSSPQKLSCRLYLNARPKDKYDSGGKDGLFADQRVRLALNLAVNKDAIVKKIFNGYALANASPVASVSYGYAAQEGYPYDPARARALRNAAIPVITVTGLSLGFMLSGAVIIETVFSWPGMGRLIVQAVPGRDFPVIQAGVFVFALIFVGLNLIVDLLYTVVDPRVRLT